MKTRFILALICFHLLVSRTNTCFSFNWSQKTSFTPGNRYGAFGFSIGTKGYVGSGAVQTGSSISVVNDLWEYDPASDSWTQMATCPGSGRAGAATFTSFGKGIVTTGSTIVTYLNDTWQYDPQTNAWLQLANFPGGLRHTCSSFTINDYGFVGGGNSNGNLSDFYRYNSLTDIWTPIASIPGTPRQSAFGFSINGYGYVVGGADESISYDGDELWQYEPIGDTWIQKASYPGSGSHGFSGFVINDIAYVGLGATVVPTTSNVYDDFYSYDPSIDLWASVNSFGGGIRQGAASMTIGNFGYVGLGSTLVYPGVDYRSDWWTYGDVTGVEEKSNAIGISVFFNLNKELIVDLNFTTMEQMEFTLFNDRGQLISRSILEKNHEKFQFDYSNLSSGIYYYSINGKTNYFKGKVALLK